jgi:hypothetical protein
MLRRTIRAVSAAVGAGSLAVVAAVQMSPAEIGSNLSTYLRAWGYANQPDWLLSPSADRWALIISGAVATVSAMAFLSTWIRSGVPDRATHGDSDAAAGGDATEKLEIVYRVGEPFLEEQWRAVGEPGQTPARSIEKLVGVRNLSSRDVHGVRVQVASASQATRGLPLTLPPRDGPSHPFSLAPGEMRLVRFLHQEAGAGRPLGMAALGGKGGPPCSARCDLVLAAYAEGAATLRKVSVWRDERGELRVRPPALGDLPGGVEPAGYVRFVVRRIERKNP